MIDHIPDVTKMIQDTPRTDEFIGEHSEWSPAPRKNWPAFARTLERELNAANDFNREIRERNEWLNDKIDAASQRIKLLEAVTNNPHALWANWLRGSVTLPVGIGDVREYQERIKRLEEAGDRILNANNDDEEYEAIKHWTKAKEAKP
jgi:hypothetical protein